MTALLLAVVTVLHAGGFKNTHVIIHSDNEGVRGALKPSNLKSRGPAQNEILRHIVRHIMEDNIWITVQYVNTKDNPADGPSRGIFPLKNQIYSKPPKLPSYLKPYLHNAIQHNDPRIRQ